MSISTTILVLTDLTLLASEGNLCTVCAWDRAREHFCNHACRFTG